VASRLINLPVGFSAKFLSRHLWGSDRRSLSFHLLPERLLVASLQKFLLFLLRIFRSHPGNFRKGIVLHGDSGHLCRNSNQPLLAVVFRSVPFLPRFLFLSVESSPVASCPSGFGIAGLYPAEYLLEFSFVISTVISPCCLRTFIVVCGFYVDSCVFFVTVYPYAGE